MKKLAVKNYGLGKRRYIISLFLIAYFGVPAKAQVELVVGAGSSHFLGDLGGKPSLGTHDIQDLNLQSTRYMLTGGARFWLGNRMALRTSLYYARVSADDKYTTNPERKNRNLNFFSALEGANAILEMHFANAYGNPGRFYIFGGAEFFHFDPRTKYNGQTVRLQPLGTEGQFFMPGRSPYKLYSWAIPFGAGYKILDGEKGTLSFEVQARKTFTDYIDDVSTTYVDKTQLAASNGATAAALSDRSLGDIPFFSDPGTIRGHSANKDNFFFLSVTYSIKLGAGGSGASFQSRARNRGHSRRGINTCGGF